MSTQELTLELPKSLFQQLAQIAKLTHQPIESLAIQSISSNLPPTVENAPLEMQTSLQKLQTFSIEELLNIAHSQIPATQQQRHLTLLTENQATDSMSFEKRQELRELGQKADQLTLKKAYAWAILRWRGYRIPNFTFRAKNPTDAKRTIENSLKEVEDLFVLSVWSKFERFVRDYLQQKGATLKTTNPAALANPLYEYFYNEVEYWKPNQILNLLKISSLTTNPHLIGQAKQVFPRSQPPVGNAFHDALRRTTRA